MRFVVTVPENRNLIEYARLAREQGADLVEVRSDLPVCYSEDDLAAVVLPVLYSVRSLPLDEKLFRHAELVDIDLPLLEAVGDSIGDKVMISFHAGRPLPYEKIIEMFEPFPGNISLKYVEPHGADQSDQYAKLESVGTHLRQCHRAVSLLVYGAGSLQLRRGLGRDNDLYYCALEPEWASAEGQGLLAREIHYFKGIRDADV